MADLVLIQWKGPYRVDKCNVKSGSVSCCIEDTIYDVKMVLSADELLPIDISILKTIPVLIAEICFLYDAEPFHVSRVLTVLLNTDSFRSFLFLLPYGLDIPGLIHIDECLHALFDRCTLKGSMHRCLLGIQSDSDRVRQLSIIEFRRILRNGKLPDLMDNDFISVFQCCISALLHRAHVGAPKQRYHVVYASESLALWIPGTYYRILCPKSPSHYPI